MIWTIPNILTMARIAAVLAIVLCFAVIDRPLADWLALGLFVVAALTDFLDGWLARKYDQVSDVGKMLDPIADKVMVIVGLMIVLANAVPFSLSAGYTTTLILFPAALIGVREVLISGMREYLGEVKLPVTRIAKWKTTVQLIAVGSGLLMGAFEPDVNRQFFRLLSLDPQRPIYTTPIEVLTQRAYFVTGLATVILLWIAALLTVISGWDYFRKGLAHIQAREAR